MVNCSEKSWGYEQLKKKKKKKDKKEKKNQNFLNKKNCYNFVRREREIKKIG